LTRLGLRGVVSVSSSLLSNDAQQTSRVITMR